MRLTFDSSKEEIASKRKPGQILRPYVKPRGHAVVSIRKKNAYVHSLILLAFTGPKPKGREACHRNDVKLDNRPENLYWGTHAENMADAVKNGYSPHGERQGSVRKITQAQVRAIRKDNRLYREIGEDYGLSTSHVSRIKDRTKWKRLPD